MDDAKEPVCDAGAYLPYVTAEQTGSDKVRRNSVRFYINQLPNIAYVTISKTPAKTTRCPR